MSMAHCEIVIPPAPVPWDPDRDLAPAEGRIFDRYIEQAVAQVMASHEYRGGDREDEKDLGRFHDGCQIGGDFAGSKTVARCDRDKLQAFKYWLVTQNIIQQDGFVPYNMPPGEQQRIDTRWNELFPARRPARCPMFQYAKPDLFAPGMKGALPGDVLRLADLPRALQCFRMILAAPVLDRRHQEAGRARLETVFTVCQEHDANLPRLGIIWDHTVTGGLTLYQLLRADHPDRYPIPCTPAQDWLAVTVTCHS